MLELIRMSSNMADGNQQKAPALKTETMAVESHFASESCFVSLFLTN